LTKWVEYQGHKIKERFIKHYEKIVDDVWFFLDWSLRPLRKAIRINTIKLKDDIENRFNKENPFPKLASANEILKTLEEDGWQIKKVPWYSYGYWLEHSEGRRDIGNTWQFQLGYIYSQEPASMIPPLVLDPKPGELVLDMAAAPGSKTIQMAMHMENYGKIIANDVELDRIVALAENVQRTGSINVAITQKDGRYFKRFKNYFDKVLLDAPCSGVGALRKSYKTLQMWNEEMILRLSKLQRQLIQAAFEALKPGGILVYSTCTLEPLENEFVVNWLLERYDNAKIERIKVEGLKSSEPILEWEGKKFFDDIQYTLRIYPWDNDTEGFFVAKIRKLE